MFKVKIADLVVEIDHIYPFVKEICKSYIYTGDGFDFRIKSTQADIDKERSITSEEGYSDGYLENICIYRQIALRLLEKDAFVMHAAVIGVGDKAYAFTAKSGTGKSTHIALWKRFLGDRVSVINGDKPILRFIDGKLYAYGTPWCGKEMWNTNMRAELNGLCFLERAKENKIVKITPMEASPLVMKQILIPNDAEGVIKTFEMVDKMLSITNLWRLGCNISQEAAIKAYMAMHGGYNEN